MYPSSAYRRHEQAKKREYGQRIREVERGVFTPLVLSTTGGMGREVTTFYKRLADMHDCPETTTCLSSCDGMAKVSALLCFTQSIRHVHPRQQILLSPSQLWVKHHPGNIGGTGPSFLTLSLTLNFNYFSLSLHVTIMSLFIFISSLHDTIKKLHVATCHVAISMIENHRLGRMRVKNKL